jgi:hypothetical protein
MVQASSPIDRRVTQPLVQTYCSLDAGTSIQPDAAKQHQALSKARAQRLQGIKLSNMQWQDLPKQRHVLATGM